MWPTRAEVTWTDSFLDVWLDQVLEDAIGFAGSKAIRRVIGLAKVSDIETLPHPEHVRAAAMVLGTATVWIKLRKSMDSVAAADDVFAVISTAVARDGIHAAYQVM
jgi:5-methylthioribose kinase